jgi:biotin transport system permease protein
MKSLYSDQPSWLHRIPAGLKLAGLLVLSILLFALQEVRWLALLALVPVTMLASMQGALRRVARFLKGLALVCLLLIAFHSWLGQTLLGVTASLRLVSATVLGLTFTLSTRHTDLISLFEHLLSPLRHLGVNPTHLALQLSLMLRFVEHFFALWQKLDDAHRLRTGRRGGFKILAPLTLQMLATAQRVADALFLRLRS